VYHPLLDQGIDPTGNDNYPTLHIAKLPHREEWRAVWECPECEREVVEYFDSYPTVEEITVYSDCPICNSDNKSEVDLAQETERSFDRHRLSIVLSVAPTTASSWT